MVTSSWVAPNGMSMRKAMMAAMPTTTESFADDANCLGTGGVCVFFSMNGRGHAGYAHLADKVRAAGGHVHLITMNPKLPLRDHVTGSVVLPWVSHLDFENFLEDQIISLAFIEILLYKVTQQLG